eukprot:Skav206994  [mRNA]  locus=scaffold3805:64524:65003:+ [translate_table: standard]
MLPEAVMCAYGDCKGVKRSETNALTSVSLADATWTLRKILCRTPELLNLTGFDSVGSLDICLAEEGHVSLPLRMRADVIIGSQKATQYDMVTVANFKLLKVSSNLTDEWDTPTRPALSYVVQGNVAELSKSGLHMHLLVTKEIVIEFTVKQLNSHNMDA